MLPERVVYAVREACRRLLPRHRRRYRSLELDDAVNTVYRRLAHRLRRKPPAAITPAYVHTSAWKEARHYFARDVMRFYRPLPEQFVRDRERDEAARVERTTTDRTQDGFSVLEYMRLDAALDQLPPDMRHDLLPHRFPDPRPAGSPPVNRSARYRRKERAIRQLRKAFRSAA